jgi:filamentous hemagglutinin
VVSGHDINITGSNIVCTNDVTLKAAHDVTVIRPVSKRDQK